MNKDDNILKISKYAFFIDRDIGDILIYSSLSGTLIRIYDAKAIEEINRIRNAETIEYTENYIIKTLCDKKFYYAKMPTRMNLSIVYIRKTFCKAEVLS